MLLAPLFHTLARVLRELDQKWRHQFCQQKQRVGLQLFGQRRAEQERALQSQHIRLQNELINRSHDAILVRDPINRVLSWNRGAEELYGWTQQEALGHITHVLLKTRFPASRAEKTRSSVLPPTNCVPLWLC
jgi:PAS domain-containing protein